MTAWWSEKCILSCGVTDRGGGGQGAECLPETSDREIFAYVSGKKRQGKKGKGMKIKKKRRKIEKEKVKNWEFSTGKKHFTSGKKSGKMTLPPQKNMPVTPLITSTNGKSNLLLLTSAHQR